MREKQTTLQTEQEHTLHTAIACLKDEQTMAEMNKATAIRQLRETNAEGQRVTVEYTKTLAALDQQITHRQATLMQMELSLETLGKSRRDEETKLLHQQLLCRAAREELVMLEEQTRKLRIERTTKDSMRVPSSQPIPTTATATTTINATTTVVNSELRDAVVSRVTSTLEDGHGVVTNVLSSNQPSFATLNSNTSRNNNNNNNNNNSTTTTFATTNDIPSLLSSSSLMKQDTMSAINPTPTTMNPPPPPPPLREQIAKLRQQSQQILRNNHAATAAILRPYNSSI